MFVPPRPPSARRVVRPVRESRRLRSNLLLLTLAICSAVAPAAHAESYRLNAGGTALSAIGFEADNAALRPNAATATAKSASGVSTNGAWGPVYETYRFANAGDLVYAIPVPSSTASQTFDIALLFTESWPTAFKKGFRLFDVLLNGKKVKSAVDVFAAVGANKPFYLPLPGTKPLNGKLVITIARLPGKQNPMLSGFVINGPSILSTLPTSPSDSEPAPPVTPTVAPVLPVDPPTPATPSGSGDPTCATGFFAENAKTQQKACCPKECGQCGGAGCSNFAPGQLCCISSVWNNAPSCNVSGPPCKLVDEPTAPTPTPGIAEPSVVPLPDTHDPTCTSGIIGENTTTKQKSCCPKECGKCGGTGCNNFAPGKLCCISSVWNTSPSCSVSGPPCKMTGTPAPEPTTPVTPVSPGDPSAPPASGSGDPTCSTGIFAENKSANQKACCPQKCGKCGGSGCGNFAPGTLCCISSVFNNAPSCNVEGPPCVPSEAPPSVSGPTPGEATEPVCTKGILGKNDATGQAACCPTVCGKCGGAKCSTFAPPNICCISSVIAIGKSCVTNDPPCIPTTGGAPPPPKPPATTPPPAPSSDPNTCPISGTSPNEFRMNVAGGANAGAALGADNAAYISSPDKGQVFSKPGSSFSAADGAKEWDVAYTSHRWTKASVLAYSIPVPSGTFTVKLLFAETFFNKPKLRLFDIFINGVEKQKDVDVYALAGMNKGLILSFPGIIAKAGQIAINLIKTVENPFISGIFIEGPGAGTKAFGGGCKAIDDEAPASELNGGFNHRAHSVPGGPYIATDFDKNGKAFVSFDGTQSHSHYSDPGPPEVSGKIVSYKWTWTEPINGMTVIKSNTDKSGKFTTSFPLGKTKVMLEVVDSTGDVAVDSVIVEVKNSAENGAYCYYYDYGDDVMATVMLPQNIDSNPKPEFGTPSGTINFLNADGFPKFSFKANSFAVRCVFFIDAGPGGALSYDVQHNGPFKIYHSGALLAQSGSSGTTSTPSKVYSAGLQPFQLLYFRPKNIAPLLALKQGGSPLTSTVLQHDSSITLPVIISLSKSTSTPSGGQNIQIYGSGFINGVSVMFGSVDAQNLMSSDPGTLQITVPPGTGEVFVTVSTNAGTSNKFPFKYVSEATLNQPVIFKKTSLKNQNGDTFKISFIAAAAYGPDGRLYLGSIKGQLHALGIDKDLKVTTTCQRGVGGSRAVLGVAFSPFTNALKMYFTTSTLYWKDDNKFPFEQGWPNGKIQAITFNAQSPTDSGGKQCAFAISDVVTGLPVSNHDHGINKLTFTTDGNIVVSIGGFTNGGVSVPGKKPVPNDAQDDALGGVASNPLSAALVSCPVNKVTNIKYDQYVDPEKSKIVSGTACTLYATGFRNSFGMTVHTNGKMYATDNGPNAGFGAFSTNCNGGFVPPKNLPDRLYAVQKGGFHGHPNLNRKECVHYPPSAVQPLLKNIKSAATGVMEYRSNTFGGEIKSNLYISKFSGQNEGTVSQVKVKGNNVGYAPSFLGYSGVEIVEGPRGELVMPRVYKFEIVVAQPTYPVPDVTFMLGVHPKHGPASGGTRVLISGHNFGSAPKATFGGTPCTNVEVIDTESFKCTTPAKGKNQKVPVVVTGALGESPSYGSDFWYW